MATESSVMQHGESLIAAKDRIQTGPVPGWVVACPFGIDFKPQPGAHVTWLLCDRQIHAGLRQTHVHVALRLETRQAAHDQSPWRLDFEPSQQQITLHGITARRGNAQFDHASLSSARVVERPTAGWAAHDRLTLLLMLDDVRPGDLLEWCYTIENRPLLLPEQCADLFTLPAAAPVGKFYFSVRFDSARPMRWKSSEPEWQPVETRDNGNVSWVWTQDSYPGLPPEENRPDWHIAHPWIQVSDCPAWGKVAAAFAQAWPMDENDAAVGKIAAEIAAGPGGIPEQAERAVQLVQNEYRYLAVDGELDGHPPTAPGVAARRRYGDSKDLSFLLAHVLQRLGVPARLVLVNTKFCRSLAELLPAPGLFDHLLVEYAVKGKTRWVDVAPKQNRGIRDYGAGLPVDARAAGLVEPPEGSVPGGIYELKESILLDTSGGWSLLGVAIAARGLHAAALRRELEREGLEGFAKKRLRDYADRFINVRRPGPLEYRDDRDANEFFLAEIFEIKDFLVPDPKTKWYKLEMANDYTAAFLKVPEAGPRRAPYALPHPCNIVHTITLHAVSLPPAVVQQRSVVSAFVSFTRLRKTLAGFWTMKLTLSTLADAVPAESLEEHRETIDEIRAQSAWSILVPMGDKRPNQRGDFGALPDSFEPATPVAKPMQPRPSLFSSAVQAPSAPVQTAPKAAAAVEKETVPAAASASAMPAETKTKRRKRNGRKRSPERSARWHVMGALVFGLVLILIVVLVARNADRWGIFKKRPAPPVTPLNTLPTQ